MTDVRALLRDDALERLLAARAEGAPLDDAAAREAIARADTLALGAAADRARRAELGDEVRIFPSTAPATLAGAAVVASEPRLEGTALLRDVARRRLLGPVGQRIVVDFAAVGLEIAQIALSFGASDLAGPIATKKGLPLLDDGSQKQLRKKNEIARSVERAGFRPVFVGPR